MPQILPSESRAPGARPSICIVTSELVGPFNNGGIGTSMTGLAQALAAGGFPLTILYTGGRFTSPGERERWRGLYAGLGIELVWLEEPRPGHVRGPLAACGFAVPWQVYDYLKVRHFDVVQFNDCMGEGFYCLAMRRLGAAFEDTSMFVALHSPSQWIFEINRTPPDCLLHAAFNQAERVSVRCADLLWGPSRYLLDWAGDKGFRLPDATYVQRYVLPTVPLFGEAAEPTGGPPAPRLRFQPGEIVFFGRLEERKGLGTFCDSLDRLNDELAERGIKVTFLGKEGTLGGRPSLDVLAERGGNWRFDWSIISDHGQQEAIAHLGNGRCVAVMASPADNSPCTVYEAMALGIPFIAARTGGIPELVDEADHHEALFAPDAASLAARIGNVIRDGIVPARPAEAPAETHKRWIAIFESHAQLGRPGPPPPTRPPRVVAVVDAAPGIDVSDTLASLGGVESIIRIARSPDAPPAAAPAPIVMADGHRVEGLLEALASCGAEAILLLRGGAVLAPGAVAAMSRVLACDADGVIPCASIGAGEGTTVVPPLGSSPSFCLFEGALPGGAMLVNLQPLVAVAEGRLSREAEFFGLADAAVAGGLELWPYADPMVHHTTGLVTDPFSRHTPERIQAYAEVEPIERFYIAAIAHGRTRRRLGPAPALRAMRDRLVAYHLGWVVPLAERTLPRAVLRRLRGRG